MASCSYWKVGEQAARRRERSIERRIVAARFAERKTIDTFDWNFNKTIQRVLIVDEFGFDRIEREECPQAAHLLYKIIASRHQIRSTILVTNVDFDAWAEYLGDAPLAMAMLDRLVDGSIIIKLKGPSYRASRSANMNQ